MSGEMAYQLDLRLLGYDEATIKHRTRELTREQRQLLKWIAKGQTNRRIALRTMTSDKTVRNQLTRMYRVLEVPGREAAIKFYNGK